MNYEKSVFLGRLGETAGRLSLVMLLAAMLPVIAAALSAAYALVFGLYIALLFVIAVCTLFTLFLSEGFRNLFSAGAPDQFLNAVGEFMKSTTLIAPYFIAASLVLCGVAVTIGFTVRTDSRARTSKNWGITVAVLCVVYLVVYILLRDKLLLGVTAGA